MILTGPARRLRAALALASVVLLALACLPRPAAAAEPLPSLDRSAAPDTVRTNLWLVQALMAEIVREAASALPPPPGTVVLEPRDLEPGTDLFTVVAGRVLGERGYTVAIREPQRTAAAPKPGAARAGDPGAGASTSTPSGPGTDPNAGKGLGAAARAAREQSGDKGDSAGAAGDSLSAAQAEAAAATPAVVQEPVPGGHLLRYRLERVDLAYPGVGRVLGFWRQWVERRFEVAALVTVIDGGSGSVLMTDRLARSYGDRLPGGRLDAVRSSSYPFTDAEVQESGWRRRLEEIVVIGTLTGLVAVYFANTGD